MRKGPDPKNPGDPIVSPSGVRRSSEDEHRLVELCAMTSQEALDSLGSTVDGLGSAEAERRLDKYGLNEPANLRRPGFLADMFGRVKSPLVVQLLVIALVSALIGELEASIIVAAMILLSVGLSYILDRRSNLAVEALGKRVQSRTFVMREGTEREVRISNIVPGDIVLLQAGSMVPADLRLTAAKDLFVGEAALTGESMPVEKAAAAADPPVQSALELPNACFFGTSVTSGTGRGVAVNTGPHSLFGAMTVALAEKREETDFDRGIRSFTWLMLRFMLVMVGAVFFIVGMTKGNWLEALLFALSIAVGLTPEMLPMIVTVNLAKGALTMAGKKVIIKRLPSIQNFGAMDILCTDKTGTLTQDRVVLEHHVDILGSTSEEVLGYAYLHRIRRPVHRTVPSRG